MTGVLPQISVLGALLLAAVIALAVLSRAGSTRDRRFTARRGATSRRAVYRGFANALDRMVALARADAETSSRVPVDHSVQDRASTPEWTEAEAIAAVAWEKMLLLASPAALAAGQAWLDATRTVTAQLHRTDADIAAPARALAEADQARSRFLRHLHLHHRSRGARHPDGACIFCQFTNPAINTVIGHTRLAYARRDNFPVTAWHVEIVPKRHVVSVFDLTWREIISIHRLLRRVARELGYTDYTIGINEGPAAGRTIDHAHIHLLPRTDGDVPHARGGIRNIFPNDAYSQMHDIASPPTGGEHPVATSTRHPANENPPQPGSGACPAVSPSAPRN